MIKKKLKIFCVAFFLSALVFSGGIFIKPREITVLKGRYNLNVILQNGSQTKILGSSVSGSIVKKALLALGKKQVDCLFINSLSKSYFYMLKDFDLKIKNIYLPYGEIPTEIEPLLLNTKAKITQIFPGKDYCGVSVESGWVLIDVKKETSTNNNLSFKTSKIAIASNLKTVENYGQVITF